MKSATTSIKYGTLPTYIIVDKRSLVISCNIAGSCAKTLRGYVLPIEI